MDGSLQKSFEPMEANTSMSLLKKNKVNCCTLIQTEADDEAGGYRLTIEADKQFRAAIILNTEGQITSADASQADITYKIITTRDVVLVYHDIVQRLDNEKCYRVTSNGDKRTPKGAGLDMVVYQAEPYELEKEGDGT